MKLLREGSRLDDRETVLPWIYRASTNHCLNLKRNARRRATEAMEDELEVAASVSPDLYPDRQLTQQVLSRFDEETRAVAVGVIVDGMEHQEVARALGISTRTVARKLDRFLDNARKFVVRSAS
jgi:RNA polymerase sigma-70 factor, ECF subfamily